MYANLIPLAQLVLLTGMLAGGLHATAATTSETETSSPTPGSDPGEPQFPRYKPSSRSPEPLDIRTNGYGASRAAPDALAIGDRAPLFNLPQAGGGTVSLQAALTRGFVAIIFYRGHW